ncbi:glycogenin-1-like isoform X1 [Montipora capricornis]|uniref:glycogenin-1-like isoform X1 n=1 Tax=Montipora capricornis TaxID=246305 RepID=UPI0035F1DCAF
MSGEIVEDEAFVSLVTNNSYANGALVLGYSLRRVNTTRKLVLLVAREVLEPTRERLARVWDHLEIVDLLDSEDTTHLALLARPELGITFTKIHCWNLTQYRKCVFLDADTLVVQNCDELFERDELSAVPDIGWPDCFNSGVFVFEPSRATYEALLEHAVQNGSFDGGDQGLLNSFFTDWRTADISRHLSFIYNMNSNASYTYLPAFQQFGRDVKIVHFIGPIKPWHHDYNPATGNVSTPSGNRGYVPHERTFLQLWWDIYVTFVQPEMRQCHDDQADGSAASEHFHPTPHSEHNFEPPPPQQHFHHEPFIPSPDHFYHPPPPPPPPSQYHEPNPQHWEPPPQHHHNPHPDHYQAPPQHYTPPPPSPQHYEPPPQNHHNPHPHHHEHPSCQYTTLPQHCDPPPPPLSHHIWQAER